MVNDNIVAACDSRYALMFVLNAIISFNLCKFVVTRDTGRLALCESERTEHGMRECATAQMRRAAFGDAQILNSQLSSIHSLASSYRL